MLYFLLNELSHYRIRWIITRFSQLSTVLSLFDRCISMNRQSGAHVTDKNGCNKIL